MRTEDIRAVLAVAEHGNLTQTATALHLAGPTLSETVRRVEAHLGVDLFVRTNRGMTVTLAGQSIMRHLHAIVNAETNLLNAGTRPDGPASVKVGTLIGFGTNWLQTVAADPPIIHGGPLEISIETTSWDDIVGGLTDGAVDAAILAGPCDHDGDFGEFLLGHDSRVVLVGRQHPLASLDSVTVADIDEAGWIVPDPQLISDQRWYAYWIADNYRPQDRNPRISREVKSASEMVMAVRGNEGVITSLAGLGEHFAFDDVVLRPVSDLRPCAIRLCHQIPPTVEHAQLRDLANSLRAVIGKVVSHPYLA